CRHRQNCCSHAPGQTSGPAGAACTADQLCQHADNLRRNLQLFCTGVELQRITIATVHTIAHNLLKEAGEAWQPVEDQHIIEWLQPLLAAHPCPLDAEAVLVEWRDVIQAQAISSWEGYRSASRTGRGRPLTVKDRKVIWEIIVQLQHRMLKRRETDFSGLC